MRKLPALTQIAITLTCFGVFFSFETKAQNDLPSPTPNIQTIPVGSLVIPMDNTLQAIPGYFNLKAYGLVNQLLQNNIPVKWAIKAGKSKDGIDFSADAQRVKPSVQFANWFDFKSGPFIVDSAYASAAKTLATSFGGSVTVYQLTANVNVDIRYTINFKPKIAVCSNGGNQNVHLDILTAAGMNNAAWVTVIPASQVVPFCGYTLVSEPHWDTSGDTTHTRAVYRYLMNGGNFFAQCKGVRTYENDDTIHTTTGITIQTGTTMTYLNNDMPIMQFDGTLTNPGGSLQYWDKNAGGAFRATTYTGIRTSGSPVYQYMNGAKVISNSIPGGNMFYLGGHDYNNTTSNGEINGRRIYLNSIFIPPNPTAWCSTLPVKLLYFQALPEDNSVTLRWATASEENNDHFILERSQDGIEYTSFQNIEGSGTTSSVHYYLSTDKLPRSGKNYYRLTQVDYDGKKEVFEPVLVDFKAKKIYYSVYPNPTVEGIYVHAFDDEGLIYSLELSDVCTGRSFKTEVDPKKEQGDFYWKIPDKVGPGVYSLKISDAYHESIVKLIITDRKP